MTPEEEQELAELEELERLEAEEGGLAAKVDPSLDVLPQALAVQPATTHPGGDEGAQADWVVRGADSAKGSTVVYEPPLAVARKELMEKPGLLKALFPSEEIPPDFIQMMDEDSDIYKTYADHKWGEAAKAAQGAGKTAYRQSRMPWLNGEAAGLNPLSMLVTKARATIDPVMEGAQAFVLGVDDTAAFGAGRRAGEALDRVTGSTGSSGDTARGAEGVGGVSQEALAGADPEAVNEMLTEGNPGLHTAGQLAGLFTPFGPAGALFKGLAKGAGAAAKAVGGGAVRQGAAKLGTAAAGAVVGGGAAQAAREGVEAAANLGKTGETGTTLEEASGRIQGAALDPTNLALGVGGEAAGMVAGGVARGIANSPRYGGNVERFEQLGGKMKIGRGPVAPPEVDEVIAKGKARDISPVDVIAEEISPKIAAAEDEAVKAVKLEAQAAHSKYYESREGKMLLPANETANEAVRQLRRQFQAPEGGGPLRPVGKGEAAKRLRAEFSSDVGEVSLKPTPGAIELTPDEAEAFLTPALQSKLVPKPSVPPPAGKPPAGGTVNEQGVNVITPSMAAEARRGSWKPSEAGPKTPIDDLAPEPVAESMPGRPSKAERASRETTPVQGREVGRGQQERLELDPLRDLSGPARREAKRMEALAKETGIGRDVDVMAERTGEQLGSSKGGFFRGSDGVERYVKQTSVESQALDEAATTAAYQALGAETVQARAGKHGGKPIVYSEKLGDEWQPLSKFKGDATPEMAKGYVRGVPADVMLGSWDLAANPNNIMTDGKRIMRIDAGGMGPRSLGTSPLQAWEEGLAAFDLDSTGSAAARGGLRQKWAARAGGKQAPERAEMPYVLAKSGGAQSLSDVKADLAAGLADVEKAIDAAGGEAGFVKQHFPHLHAEDAKAFTEELGKRRRFLRDNIDKIAMATALGIGASVSEEGGASAAAAGGLAMALKKKGVGKVYVTPRRYNAQQHELRKEQLQVLARDPANPGAREAKKLYAAAMRDRDARPMDGQPGGWSVLQKSLSEKIGAAKGAAGLSAPGGNAYRPLVKYAQQRPGEGPLKQAVESAGARAGVEPQLRHLRMLDPLQQLRNQMTYRGKVMPRGQRGMVGALADTAALRFAYPALQPLGSAGSPIRGGMLGPRVQQLGDNTPEEEER